MPSKKTTRKAATPKPTPRPVATCTRCGRPGHGADDIECPARRAARADIAAGHTAPGGKADRAAAVDGACEKLLRAANETSAALAICVAHWGRHSPEHNKQEVSDIHTELLLPALPPALRATIKPAPVADDGLLDLLRMVARKPRECSDSPYMRDKAVLKFEDYELARIDAAIAKATTQAGGPPASGAAPSAD